MGEDGEKTRWTTPRSSKNELMLFFRLSSHGIPPTTPLPASIIGFQDGQCPEGVPVSPPSSPGTGIVHLSKMRRTFGVRSRKGMNGDSSTLRTFGPSEWNFNLRLSCFWFLLPPYGRKVPRDTEGSELEEIREQMPRRKFGSLSFSGRSQQKEDPRR